jgi:hypothetical protein
MINARQKKYVTDIQHLKEKDKLMVFLIERKMQIIAICFGEVMQQLYL